MKLIRRSAIILIALGLLSLYFFGFRLSASALKTNQTIEFERTDFVDAETLNDNNKLVASNDLFNLYLDETTSYFKVEDKRSGEVWQSNPTEKDPWETDPSKPITNTAIEKQKSTLELTYVNKNGSSATINNYTTSIAHPGNAITKDGLRTYSINYIDGGFQVLYRIENLDIDYLFFPKYIDKDVFEGLEKRRILESLAYTGFDEEKNAYEIKAYESMSGIVRDRLYQIFYNELGYTLEQTIEENKAYGYTKEYEKIVFELAIQVLLTEKGINTSIIKDSIKETGDVKIANIALYPLFGTAISHIDDKETEGYIVLPDGSGAIIEFNNGKYYQNPYRKRLYGQDLALLPYKMREQQQDITIPVYGMVKENGGFAAIITEGDTMAWINADVSGRIDSYNNAYVSFSLRESEAITLGSGFSSYGITLWTKSIVDTDFTVSYEFLTGSDNTYVGIANSYRNYLREELGMKVTDTTRNTVVSTEMLGAYDKKEFFLGVPYNTTRSLTTFKQAKKIIENLEDEGINDLNVLYAGLANGGLSNDIEASFDIEKVLGGKKGFDQLVKSLGQKDIDVFASVNLMIASKYNRFFDQYAYTASRLNGKQAFAFNYHYPSRLPYTETTYEHSANDFVINPLYYQAIYNKLEKDFDYDQIHMATIGSKLAGSYDKANVVYKEQAIYLQEQLLKQIDKEVMLSNPLGFAMPYASYITDLPTETTLYSIIDDQIPLLQLVLSGLVDYSSTSINLSSDRSIDYNFLKVIETGSNLKYTLSYDDSKELINTEYNNYMSTHYVNWVEDIKEQTEELNRLGIHKGYLINHERVMNNVYKVMYSSGLTIVLNYNLSPIVYQGKTISSMDYFVVQGA
jgi:hypothetical protein